MMRWLYNFMIGRRGVDKLNIALIVVFFIISALFMFLPDRLFFLIIIQYIPFVLCLYRMLSKDIYKREQENHKFVVWWNNFYPKLIKKANRIKDSKTHKYIKCPNCKQLLRLPRGRGKIRISCPKCLHTFEKRT